MWESTAQSLPPEDVIPHSLRSPHVYHAIPAQHTRTRPTASAQTHRRGRQARKGHGGMAAVNFAAKNEAELRRWVEANPEHVNDKDVHSETPLFVAVCNLDNVPLTAWLLDKKGADLDTRCRIGLPLLHVAKSLDMVNALMDRGADPASLANDGSTVLVWAVATRRRDIIARLLTDRRVRAGIDLHLACLGNDVQLAPSSPSSSKHMPTPQFPCRTDRRSWP